MVLITYRGKCLPGNFLVALNWPSEVVLELPKLVIQVVVYGNGPATKQLLQTKGP